jgi:hypothetical protein
MTARLDNSLDRWREVHRLVDAGLTDPQIAAETGISVQVVGIYRRRTSPPRPHYTPDRAETRADLGLDSCIACGTAVFEGGRHSNRSRPHGERRCKPCENALHYAVRTERIDQLTEHAVRTGRVPTVTEAAHIVNCTRSTAGELVLIAFGPDKRSGAQRRMHPRPWPPPE